MVSKNASKSSDAAKDAMMKQAKANDATAQYIVGIYYLALASAKTDLQEQDTLRNEALAWLLKSSQNDYLWAYLALAELSALKGHDQEAASWYEDRIKFLLACLPYLIVKHQEASIVLEFLRMGNTENITKRHDYYNKLAKIKKERVIQSHLCGDVQSVPTETLDTQR